MLEVEKVLYKRGAIVLVSTVRESWILCAESQIDTEIWMKVFFEVSPLVS